MSKERPFVLPIRKSVKYPCRKTVCLPGDVGQLLERLEGMGVNTTELLRGAIIEFIDKHELQKVGRQE